MLVRNPRLVQALTALLLGGALAASTVPASAAAPGLPRTYDVIRVDSPEPLAGGSFGWGIASADLTGDQKADLLVAQAQTGKGQIFIFDGVTGRHIDTIDPPEKNPPRGDGSPADDETLAFVYVETMPDIGRCTLGDGSDADAICDDATIGAGDGIPEIVAGSRNLKVNATDGSAAPVAGDRNIGRAYVFDGATRAVLKRIDMPAAERQFQASFTGPTSAPQFGRLVMSLQGMAPCAGRSDENNAVGVGPCPDLPVTDRIGDVNGGGQPDLIITARNYVDTGAGSTAGSQCRTANAARCTTGKAWVYPGELIAGTDPRVILEQPLYGVANPFAQTGGSPEFGGNVFRVGDATVDGRPEFVVATRNLDYPLRSPDPAFEDVGAAFLFNGATGALERTLVSPEPQARSQFSGSFNSGRPVGDLGATTNPDILLPAPLQNRATTDDGMAWVMNAVGGGGGGTGSWQFAALSDPTPMIGGNFGGATTGIGDLVGGPEAPANEVLIAGFGPFDPSTEASNNIVADLHIINATTERNLQTIPHPDGVRGDGFGVGLTPMGDLNGDGFLDLATSAYLANVQLAGQGRAYIFTSNNTPLPVEATQTPTPAPVAPALTPEPLSPGACVHDVVGTMGDEHLIGTIIGDNIFGLDGNDFVNGFQGDDCIDGGRGRDRLDGGPDRDKLFGGSGADRLNGADGRDRLYGMSGGDNLVGGYGLDFVSGGSGNDRLVGGPEADKLYGEGGRDRLVGGTGRDVLDGGSGNDDIEARDGERDTILCGRGRRDLVRADVVDSVNGCERVRRGRRR